MLLITHTNFCLFQRNFKFSINLYKIFKHFSTPLTFIEFSIKLKLALLNTNIQNLKKKLKILINSIFQLKIECFHKSEFFCLIPPYFGLAWWSLELQPFCCYYYFKNYYIELNSYPLPHIITNIRIPSFLSQNIIFTYIVYLFFIFTGS